MSELGTIPTELKLGYDVKFYIKDTAGKWVDFSDTTQAAGKDALDKIGVVQNKIETLHGSLVSTVQGLTLKNEDGFFNKPFPSGLKTVDGSSASFDLSDGYKRTIITGLECKITVKMRIPNVSKQVPTDTKGVSTVSAIQEEVLGHFYVEDVFPDVVRKKLKLNLISFDHRLQEKDASGIKDGYSRYQQRPVSFLIEQILRSEFLEDTPLTYNIQKNPFLETVNGKPVVSILGRPPLWDGTNWRRDNLLCRAMCGADVNSGSGPGDVLYLGCDNELWYYDSSTGIYTAVDTSTIPSGYYIKKIIYDPTDDLLMVFAWEDEYYGATPYTTLTEGWNMNVYSWNGVAASLSAISTSEKISSTSFIQQPSYIQPHISEDLWRFMIGAFHGSIVGTVDGVKSPNVLIPFPQDVQVGDGGSTVTWLHAYLLSGGAANTELALEFTSRASLGAGSSRFANVSQGWLGLNTEQPGSDTTGLSTPMLYYWGQPYLLFMGKISAGGARKFYYIQNAFRDLSGTDTYNYSFPVISPVSLVLCGLRSIENSGSSSNIATFAPSDLKFSIPLCAIQNGLNSNAAWFFFLNQFPALGYPPNVGEAIQAMVVDTSTEPPATGTVHEIDAVSWHIPIAGMAFTNNTGTTSTPVASDVMIMVWFHRGETFGLDGAGTYTLTYSRPSLLSTTSDWYDDALTIKIRSSPAPFGGLAYDDVEDEIFIFAFGEGIVYKVDKSNNFSAVTNRPAVVGEFGLLGSLAVNQGHPANEVDLYGVSSVTYGPLESHEVYVSGKNYLFRISKYITDIIELADFEGLSKWEAVKLLTQARDGVSFFDRNGNFHYIDRLTSPSSADYTFGGVEANRKVIGRPILDYGYKNVFNTVKVKIYATYYEPPKSDNLSLIDRSDFNKDEKDPKTLTFADYLIEQKDSAKKKIYVYCLRSGTTTDGDSRWKYSTVEPSIEAILSTDALSSATTFVFQSVYGGDDYIDGIHIGDFMNIVNSDTGETLTRVITAVTESSNQITVSSSFGVALKAGAIIPISRGHQTGASQIELLSWSDEGVSYITVNASINATQVAVKSSVNLSVGTIIRFAKDTVDDDTLSTEYRITNIRQQLNDVVLTIKLTNGTTTNVLKDALLVGDKVYAYYAPEGAGEIGGTSLFITWSDGEGTAETDFTKTFVPGDRLVIDCPGIVLQEEAMSLQVFTDSVSVSKHKKREFSLNNRFMFYVIGREIGNRLLTNNSSPKYQLKITVALIPDIDIVTRASGNDYHMTQVDVVDSELFPLSQDHTESFTIKSISHNLSSGTTTLDLNGLTAY